MYMAVAIKLAVYGEQKETESGLPLVIFLATLTTSSLVLFLLVYVNWIGYGGGFVHSWTNANEDIDPICNTVFF